MAMLVWVWGTLVCKQAAAATAEDMQCACVAGRVSKKLVATIGNQNTRQSIRGKVLLATNGGKQAGGRAERKQASKQAVVFRRPDQLTSYQPRRRCLLCTFPALFPDFTRNVKGGERKREQCKQEQWQ